MKKRYFLFFFLLILSKAFGQDRPLVIVETDMGGDPDDQATMVRFLLYANEFDIKGIIVNKSRVTASREDNPTNATESFEMTIDYIRAYGQVVGNLNRHVPGNPFPAAQSLINITKKSVNSDGNPVDDGVNHIIQVLRDNPNRVIWYTDWGTSLLREGYEGHSLNRALDRIRRGVPRKIENLIECGSARTALFTALLQQSCLQAKK